MLTKTWICRIYIWSTTTAFLSAAYLILALAVDRVLAIMRPFWYKQLKFPMVAGRLFLGIVATLALVRLPASLTVELEEGATTCTPKSAELRVSTVLQVLVASAIPAIVIIGSNVVFFSRLLKRRKKQPATQVDRRLKPLHSSRLVQIKKPAKC